MDLREMRGPNPRHPWEQARAEAIERIIDNADIRPRTILDYGCGDGFTGEHVLQTRGANELLGFDVHLTDAQCGALTKGRAKYTNDWSTAQGAFDLCLLCDVLEHVADEGALLAV